MEDTAVPIAAVRDIGSDAIALELGTPPDFDALPGQFVKLIIDVDGEEQPRFYSISSPDVADTFEMTIEVDPEGEVSPHLRNLEPGDEVRLSGPFGSNYYEHEDSVLIVAGGPGIGPAVGISERALVEDNDAAIIYRDEEPIHRDRLGVLEDRGAFVRTLGPGEDLADPIGTCLSADTQIFVYGFADFLGDAMEAIGAAGGEPDTAKVENFG